MRAFTIWKVTCAVAAIVCFVSTTSQAQLWNIDLPNSALQIATSADADDFITLGFVQDIDQAFALNPGFVAPAGTFDFGNAVTSITHDGMLTSSANAFVTADGDLSNTLQVRWSGKHTQRLGTPDRRVLRLLNRQRRHGHRRDADGT